MDKTISDALAELQRQFVAELPDRVAQIWELFNRLGPLSEERASLEELHRLAHGLTGSAGTFGMGALSTAARELEQRLKVLLHATEAPAPSQWAEVAELLHQLGQQVASAREGSAPLLLQPMASQRPPRRDNALIYLVEDDLHQAERLKHGLFDHGYQVRILSSLTEFRAAWQGEERPAAIVMDMVFPEGVRAGAEVIGELKQNWPECPPVIFASVLDDLDARLAAYRAGAVRYFTKPMDTDRLASLLDQVTGRMPPNPYRVLLLDDEPLLLQRQAAILQQAGMVVEAISDPRQLLEVAHRLLPDVVVLDVYMPEISGPELAAVLREDDSYANLPILFLSAETDITQQLLALNLGGDDFLVKPVEAEHLVSAVVARARRAREKIEMMTQLSRTLYEREREHLAINQHAIVSITDANGIITYVNDKFCQISGFSRAELLGQSHRLIKSGIHPDDLYRDMWRTIRSGQVWHGEVCNRRKDGSLYWVESTITPFLDGEGKPYQYVSMRTDISKLKESEQALRAIVRGTSWVVGTAFFESAAEWLAKALQMRIGFIARIDANDESMLHTVAVWDQERIIPNFSYPVQDTPCEQTVRRGLAIFTDRVAARFPKDLWLTENHLESYIAISLYDSEGLLLGHLGAVDDKPLINGEAKVDLLRIFAARVAAEMERMAIEAEVEDQKERLRRGQVYANIGTWDWNIQSGELFWTERIGPLFGYPEDTLETSYENFLTAVHPDDRQRVTDAVTACVERDQPYDIEHRVVWPDGTERWLLERGAVVRNEQGAPLRMLGVVMDINERKMAEQARRESEEKFRTLFELSPVGIALNAMDGTFIEANRALLDAIGYGDDEYRSLTYWQVTPQEYEPQEQLQLELLRTTGRYGPYEKEYIHKHGYRVPVLLSGALVTDGEGNQRIWSIVQDISERKRAERELLIFKQLFESTAQGIGVADAQGNILYANTAHDHIHGYPVGTTLGLNISDFFTAETLRWAMEAIMGAVQSGHGWAGLLPIKRKDGSELVTAANVGFISGKDGKPEYLFNLMSDYTPELSRQRQLAEAKEAAERASQAKSEFLSSMSHELRTPMNAILGFAQILEYDEKLQEEQLDSVNEILKAGQHLLELINEVLDLAKIEAGRIDLSLEPVLIEELAAECYALVEPLAQKRAISLSCDVPHAAVVRADRVRLKQVLLNLLSNAIKYNREQGSVHCSSVRITPQRIRLQIRDSGNGIAADRLDELFKPFSRLDAEKSSVEGTGIGLTITRRLVELMGGDIGVESQLGIGSIFWVELPAETLAHAASGVADAAGAVPGAITALQNQRQVLYVEDNPVNLKLVSQLLGRRPHINLMTAHTPELGIELALAHRPQLILLDINMPGMDGYQVLSVLKSHEAVKEIPVIAVTANAMPRDIERGKAAGFSDYLTKPINARQFIETVEHWLSGGGHEE